MTKKTKNIEKVLNALWTYHKPIKHSSLTKEWQDWMENKKRSVGFGLTLEHLQDALKEIEILKNDNISTTL